MSILLRVIKSPILWILLVTVLAITALMLLKSEPPRAPARETTWSVQAQEVVNETLNPQLRLLGKVESPHVSTLSSSIAATVKEVPAQEGELVSAGDLLVALNSDDPMLLLRQAEADLTNLLAQVRQEQTRANFDEKTLTQQQALVAAAKRTVEREQQLRQSNLTSELRLDEARISLASAELNLISQRLVMANHKARLDSLQAQVSRAEALRDQAQMDVERASVRAPFHGVVTDVAVSPGERVRTGDPLMTLYQADALEIRAQLPQRWLAVVRAGQRPGQSLTATAITLGEHYPLALDRLSGQVNQAAGGIDALFRFAREQSAISGGSVSSSPQAPNLALGQTLEIILELPGVDRVISVPVSALYGTNQVFKVVDGKLQSVFVDIRGDRFTDNGQQVLVQSPELSNGDQIITTQLPNVVAGLKVQVRESVSTKRDQGL